MTQARIAIVVVNWQLKSQTLSCLHSLARLEQPHRVMVVDNGSHDGSVEHLRSAFPYISLLSLPDNVGFGAGCNRAIQALLPDPSWEFLFLVNNDATIHPAALTHLLQAAQDHPQAGIFGPKIYYENPSRQLWYAGARRRWGVLAASSTGRGQLDHGQFDQRAEIDFVFGAGMFIRREVIQTIGLFDEQFFIYLEDLDFCLRAQRAGFALGFVPQAHLWHQVSASTASLPDWRKYHQARSTILFLKKHATLPTALPLLTFWTLVSMRFVLKEALQGNLKSIRAYGSGLLHGVLPVKPRQADQLPDAS
jgi:hypothetical protein